MQIIINDSNNVVEASRHLSNLLAEPATFGLRYLRPARLEELLFILSDDAAANSVIRGYLLVGGQVWRLGKAPYVCRTVIQDSLQGLITVCAASLYLPKLITVESTFDLSQRY